MEGGDERCNGEQIQEAILMTHLLVCSGEVNGTIPSSTHYCVPTTCAYTIYTPYSLQHTLTLIKLKYVHTKIYIHMHIQTNTHPRAHTDQHTSTCTYRPTHIHVHIQTNTHPRAHTDQHTCTLMNTHQCSIILIVLLVGLLVW